MINAFAHSEWISANWPKRGIVPNTLTAGNTVNTYSASPQPAAGIDSWDAGALYAQGVALLIDVASASGGTLTVSLRDYKSAITTANGDASTHLVGTLATITAAGLYYAEFPFSYVFAATSTRVTGADADYASIMRYHSVRAVAAGGDYVFSVLAIYFNNLKGFPSSDATLKAITWAT